MPENPIYDPNKIVKRAYTTDSYASGTEEQSSNGVPKYDTSKIVKRGYVAREADFQEEGFTPDKYISDTGGDNIESTLDFIQKNSKRIMRDDEKDILRDMFRNPNATKEDISDAIVTLQGKKAKQQENTMTTPDYYMDRDEKGVYKPIALSLGEKTPKGKETVSIWGTQKKADDDAWYTDVAKTAFNIIPGVIGGVVDVAQLGTQLVAGEESDWLKQAQISSEALKFKKDIDIEKPIYNTEDINKFTDLFDSKRLDFSPETIWGTALSAAGFMGEMLVPASIITKGTKGYKVLKSGLKLVEEAGGISKLAKKAAVFAGSFMTQVGDVMESSADAGLEGRSKAVYDLTIGSALALVDAKYDVAGKILVNNLAQGAKKEILSEVGKKVVKDEFGNITKESLNQATKEAMTAYTPVVGSFVKNYGRDVLDEVKDEVLQSFLERAGQNVYDKLSPQEKANFGTDAFSAKSFGEYINSAASGLVGAGAPSLISAKGKQQVDYKTQSNNAYETVMQGEEAVKAFKTNITNAFQAGQINKEDYDNAILKVDAYDSYEKTTKDLTLDNDNKKKLFELSLQKENLKAAIKDAESKDTEGHSRLDKMNPAELGLHNAKVKQAKALQDEIDLIVTKSEVLQQPEVAEKVVEKVVKAEEKAAEGTKVKEGVSSEIGAILGRQYKVKAPVGGEVAVPGKAAYEVPKKVLEETRKMKDIPVEEFNAPNFDVTVKQAKLAEALDETKNKTTTGTLQIDNEFIDNKGRQVQTFNITLPNGKAARFASSMVRFPEENALGGFRGNTYEENLTNKENPVGQKLGATVRTLKDSGRKVIFVWNADEGPKFGKHIGMVKERLRGKSDYSEADIEEMADLRMINMGQNPNAPAPGIITPEGPTKGGPKAATPVKNKEVRDKLKGLGYSKTEIQAMEPQEANDIVKEKREKSKVKKQPLEEVEIKDKKEAAKKEKKIADLRAQEQEELKREIPNIDKYKVDGKVDENLIKNAEDLKKYKEIYKKYNEKISPLLGKEPAQEKELEKKDYTLAKNLVDTRAVYEGKIGFIRQDEGGKLTFETVDKIIELKENAKAKEIESESVSYSNGNVTVGGDKYEYVSTNINKDGDVVSVTLKKENGKIITIRDLDTALAIDRAKSDSESKSIGAELDEVTEKKVVVNQIEKEFGVSAMSIIESMPDEVADTFIALEKGVVTLGANELQLMVVAASEWADKSIKDVNSSGSSKSEKKSVVKMLNKFKNDLNKYYNAIEKQKNKGGIFASKQAESEQGGKGSDKGKRIEEKGKVVVNKDEMDKMLEGKTVPVEEGMSPKEYIRDVLSESENAGQIAEAYLMADEKIEAGDFNSKYDTIYFFFASGKRLSKQSLAKYYDERFINRKDLPGLSSYTAKEGGYSVDTDSITQFDDSITPEDVVNFIANFPNGYVEYEKIIEDSTRTKLATKFKRIAKRVLSPNLAKEVFKNYIEKEKQKEEKDYFSDSMLEEELTKEEYRKQAEEGGYYQKAKVKPATLNKFEKSVDLFYKTKDADGASKKRSLAAERREFLEKNPTVKYIDDNMKYIYKQLEEQNIIERKGECP